MSKRRRRPHLAIRLKARAHPPHAPLGCSSAEIIVSGSWHSFLEFIPLFDTQFAVLNAVIANAAAAEGARFADLVPVLNPSGEAARRTAICTLTLVCSEGDTHPSDAGYRAIANVLYETSGYHV